MISFFDLPGEIRNEIYWHIFLSVSCKRYITESCDVHEELRRSRNLLLTNRQIYEESRSLFFAKFLTSFKFHFWNPRQFKAVVQQIPTDSWSEIHGEFEFDDDGSNLVPHMLTLFAKELGFEGMNDLYDEKLGGFKDYDRMRKNKVRGFQIVRDGQRFMTIFWGLTSEGNDEEFIRIVGPLGKLNCFGEMIGFFKADPFIIPTTNPLTDSMFRWPWPGKKQICIIL